MAVNPAEKWLAGKGFQTFSWDGGKVQARLWGPRLRDCTCATFSSLSFSLRSELSFFVAFGWKTLVVSEICQVDIAVSRFERWMMGWG